MFNQLFDDMNILSIVLSKNYNFLMFHYFYFYEISLRRMVLPFLSESEMLLDVITDLKGKGV